MAKRRLRPVSIDGIEFDALIDEQKTMTSTIPTYPVENGFSTSDTIINDPIGFSATLYVTNTPVTWLQRHGTSTDRVNRICNDMEKKWMEKKLVKIVTSDAIYTNMGITSISIKKSKEIGMAREIQIQAQKVEITKKKTVAIPDYLLKSGATGASAGNATTSKSSSGTGNGSTGTSGGDSASEAKKGQSVLFGVANGLEFL